MIKTVMISQPMRGKTNEEIREERKQAVKMLENQGFYVMDTIIEDFTDKIDPIFYLIRSLEYLANADCVYFMKGWEKARGCKIEHEVAVEYGKEVIYEN